MEEVDRNQYLATKQTCDVEIVEAEMQIAELSKEMAMQAEVDDEQLKEIENISLFEKEPALTKEMAEYMIKEVRVYRDDRLNGNLGICLMKWLVRRGRTLYHMGEDCLNRDGGFNEDTI